MATTDTYETVRQALGAADLPFDTDAPGDSMGFTIYTGDGGRVLLLEGCHGGIVSPPSDQENWWTIGYYADNTMTDILQAQWLSAGRIGVDAVWLAERVKWLVGQHGGALMACVNCDTMYAYPGGQCARCARVEGGEPSGAPPDRVKIEVHPADDRWMVWIVAKDADGNQVGSAYEDTRDAIRAVLKPVQGVDLIALAAKLGVNTAEDFISFFLGDEQHPEVAGEIAERFNVVRVEADAAPLGLMLFQRAVITAEEGRHIDGLS